MFRKQTFWLFLFLVLSQVSIGHVAAVCQSGTELDIKRTTSFEETAAGQVQSFSDSIGAWKVIKGTVNISNQYAKSGKQCLHIAGGQESILELQLTTPINKPSAMTFWAERWTRRGPFEFRIQKYSDGNWVEIYNGDESVRVGKRFLSRVNCQLGEQKVERLRFVVASPAGTGLLVDDLAIKALKLQQIVKTNELPMSFPCVIGQSSPVTRMNIRTDGSLEPMHLAKVEARINMSVLLKDIPSEPHSELKEIETVEMWYTGNDPTFNRARQFGESMAPSTSITFNDKCELKDGDNYFWISIRFGKKADLDRQVSADIFGWGYSEKNVRYSDEYSNFDERFSNGSQRAAIALRKAGDDGVNTYRIPGLATTSKGSLIAVYDVRHKNSGDLPGDIDVGMSRSTDGGRTWEPMRTIIDMGNDPSFAFDGVGDPSILVDRKTGTIWVAALWSHGNNSWNGSGQGLSPDQTGQFVLVKSTDDGKTWSKPINITEQIKHPDWCLLLAGPGKGISMSDGTIAFPAQYQDPPNSDNKAAHRLPHSTFIYSRDQGETWQIATGAFDDTTEAQLVELADGQIMLNCRYNRDSKRVVMTTSDMGKTWSEHPTSRKALIEPRACMASLIDVSPEHGDVKTQWLLFSNPDHSNTRKRITIKASPDGGLTWPKEHQLLLDEGTGRGYSCMTMIDEETVGILYESSQADLVFQRIPLDAIISK